MEEIHFDYPVDSLPPSRIELIFGKTQIQDAYFYLVKFQGQPLQNSTWISTLEAYQKGRKKMAIFNRIYATRYWNNFPYISNQIIYDQLSSQKNLEESELRRTVDQLEDHFRQKLNQIRNESMDKVRLFDSCHFSKKKIHSQIKSERNQQLVNFSSTKVKDFLKDLKSKWESVLGRIRFGKNWFYLINFKGQTLRNSRWYHFTRDYINKNRKDLQAICFEFDKLCPPVTGWIFDRKALTEVLFSYPTEPPIKKQVIARKKNAKQKKIEKQLIKVEVKTQKQELQLVQELQSFIEQKKRQLSNLKLQSIQKIVGKAKIAQRTLYLVKYAESNDYRTFEWMSIYSGKARFQNKKRILDEFNKRYWGQVLPLIDLEYIDHKCYFLELLFRSYKKIEKILGKRMNKNIVFYLVKWKNNYTSKIQWLQSNQMRKQTVCDFHKKTDLEYDIQNTSYIDRQKILNFLYDEKLSSTKIEKFKQHDYIDKKLYREANQLIQMFQEQVTTIKLTFESSIKYEIQFLLKQSHIEKNIKSESQSIKEQRKNRRKNKIKDEIALKDQNFSSDFTQLSGTNEIQIQIHNYKKQQQTELKSIDSSNFQSTLENIYLSKRQLEHFKFFELNKNPTNLYKMQKFQTNPRLSVKTDNKISSTEVSLGKTQLKKFESKTENQQRVRSFKQQLEVLKQFINTKKLKFEEEIKTKTCVKSKIQLSKAKKKKEITKKSKEKHQKRYGEQDFVKIMSSKKEQILYFSSDDQASEQPRSD